MDCKTNAVVGVKRTLGSGTASMVVSAMGFGCMGLNHHRGQHPGKKQVIALVHEPSIVVLLCSTRQRAMVIKRMND